MTVADVGLGPRCKDVAATEEVVGKVLGVAVVTINVEDAGAADRRI